MEISIARDGKTLGSFSLEALKEMAAKGDIKLTDHAYIQERGEWRRIEDTPELLSTLFGDVSSVASIEEPKDDNKSAAPKERNFWHLKHNAVVLMATVAIICAAAFLGDYVQKKLKSPPKQTNTSVDSTKNNLQNAQDSTPGIPIRTDCPEPQMSAPQIVNLMRVGQNVDSRIGCVAYLSYRQKEVTQDGHMVLFTDANSGVPLAIVQVGTNGVLTPNGIFNNEPSIFLGTEQFTLGNGQTFNAASFVLTSAVNKSHLIGGAVNAALGTMTDDRDGHVYKTTSILGEKWMAENLSYNDGNGRCYDDKDENCAKYGRLYNWNYAVNACPSGWHLSTEGEWELLRLAVQDDGKSIISAINGGSDKYGFGILYGGSLNGGKYSSVGKAAFFWTSTKKYVINSRDSSKVDYNFPAQAPWYGFEESDMKFFRADAYLKPSPMSVRCVENRS